MTTLIVEVDSYAVHGYDRLFVVTGGTTRTCTHPSRTANHLPYSASMKTLQGTREWRRCPNIGFARLINAYYFTDSPSIRLHKYSELRAYVGTAHNYVCVNPEARSGSTSIPTDIVLWQQWRCQAKVINGTITSSSLRRPA